MLSLASLLKSYWFRRWDEARGGNPVKVCMCIDFLITIKTLEIYWHFSHSLMVFGATVCLLPVYVCIFELWLTFNATNLQRVPLALCSVMSWTGLWMFICVISNKKARSRLLVKMSDWRVLNDLPLASTSPHLSLCSPLASSHSAHLFWSSSEEFIEAVFHFGISCVLTLSRLLFFVLEGTHTHTNS